VADLRIRSISADRSRYGHSFELKEDEYPQIDYKLLVSGSSISRSHMIAVLPRSGVDVAFIKRSSPVFFIFLILDAIS
jgi:hypothetical protein